MKNYSNWLGFDVKIVKEGFKRGWESLKQVSHKKLYKKLILGVSRLGEPRGSVTKIFLSREQAVSREVQSRKFSRVASKPRVSRQKLLDELATGESPAEPRKTLIPVFQYRTCLKNEK